MVQKLRPLILEVLVHAAVAGGANVLFMPSIFLAVRLSFPKIRAMQHGVLLDISMKLQARISGVAQDVCLHLMKRMHKWFLTTHYLP